MTKAALLQTNDKGSPEANIDNCFKMIDVAAEQGAQIICTQELFITDYFCRTQDTQFFKYAIKIPGALTERFCKKAAELRVVLIISLFEEAMNGVYYNTSVVIDADGKYLGKYRKMHIPQDPYFEEKFYFTPGDLGVPVFDTAYGKLSVIICWDQWYPETSRLAALGGAEMIFVPTAIGWLADEKQELGDKQHGAWTQVQRGQAVANSCYYAAVNRVGFEEPIEFWGQSFACDFYGDLIKRASIEREEILLVDFDLPALREHRQTWPFFRDRRIDAYQDLNKRCIESSSEGGAPPGA